MNEQNTVTMPGGHERVRVDREGVGELNVPY